jgi:DNA invertase Pin-like site-specific DNA recombinase/predicted transcriptional regulator
MPKFLLYARKSTDEEDRQVLSIESQINELREYAKKEKLCIVDEFTEAKTAKEPGRPIFSYMLKQIESGLADGILAWHPDRLARNSIDGGKIIYLIDVGKIADLCFPTYRFDNTAQGKFMLSIMFGQSKYYVDNLSENTKRGLREKLRRGEWPGWAPLGYLNDYKDHKILVDPEKAPFVRKIFELYATGNYSLEEILREVRRWGLIGKAGKPVRKSTLAHLLRNPFYYGVMKFKNELFEASHPPLISKKLFDRVQDVLEKKSKPIKKGKVKFAFTGLIKCGECGASITAEIQKGHTYYRCTKKIVKCSQKFLREEALLEQINKAIFKVFIDNEAKGKINNRLEELSDSESKASSSQSRQAQEKLKEFDSKIERLIDLYISKEISQEEYQRKKAKLLNEKTELQERLDEIEKISGGWLEPAREFVSTCNLAGSVAKSDDLLKKRNFLKNLGSNFILKDRTLLFKRAYPYDLVAKISPTKDWLQLSDEIRTYFKESMNKI